ncbi:MAG: GTA-gp10 family protein [Pseudomonadota bacterium]
MTGTTANAVRGEATIRIGDRDVVLRPSFTALCAAEAELGPLFGLVERAAAGELSLAEMAGLFWHTAGEGRGTRDAFGDAVIQGGLVNAAPALKHLMAQILAGR